MHILFENRMCNVCSNTGKLSLLHVNMPNNNTFWKY